MNAPSTPERVALTLATAVWIAIGVWLLTASSLPSTRIAFDSFGAHVLLFAAISFPAWAALPRRDGPAFLSLLVVVAAGAVLTEVGQALQIDGRAGSVSDAVADIVGMLVGVALCAGVIAAFKSIASFSIVAGLSFLSIGLLFGFIALPESDTFSQSASACPDPARDGDTNLDEPIARVATDSFTFSSAGSSVPLSPPVVTDDFATFYCRAIDSQAFTVLVNFQSSNITQDGPTRIVTSSSGVGGDQFNFHLGQSGPNLTVRLRVGADPSEFSIRSVEGVIDPSRAQAMALVFERGRSTVWVDGALVDMAEHASPDLDGWVIDYPLLFGNEFTGDRGFEGDVFSIDFYDRALTGDELSG